MQTPAFFLESSQSTGRRDSESAPKWRQRDPGPRRVPSRLDALFQDSAAGPGQSPALEQDLEHWRKAF